jgi:GNAT superfamily N-acetyltransferase
MSPLTLRAAEGTDAEGISRLINVAFLAERPFVKGERIDLARVRQLLLKGEFLLGFQNSALMACVYLELHRPRAYLGLLAIDPSHQQAGLGTELMAAAEERCRAAGCSFVDLRFINHRAELLRFYTRLGYQESGTAAFPETARMKMPFHFIQMSKALS